MQLGATALGVEVGEGTRGSLCSEWVLKNGRARFLVASELERTLESRPRTERVRELILVDEAATIPNARLRAFFDLKSSKSSLVLASTVTGYEGTGRSFSLKLVRRLISERNQKVLEIEMQTPIRYGPNDLMETLTYELCCLNSGQSDASSVKEVIVKNNCTFKFFRKDELFGSKATPGLLEEIWGLFVASHYRNSPNDLLLLADAPSHHVCVLRDESSQNIVCAAQICLEGGLLEQEVSNGLHRGSGNSGDMIAWKLVELQRDPSMATHKGLRIVRIATHPAYMKKGLATHLIEQLRLVVLPNPDESRLADTVTSPFAKGWERVDWIATSYGLTNEVFAFWRKAKFLPIALGNTRNEWTGEVNCVMIDRQSTLSSSIDEKVLPIHLSSNLLMRLSETLGLEPECSMGAQLIASMTSYMLQNIASAGSAINRTDCTNSLSPLEIRRLRDYCKRVCDKGVCRHLWKSLARMYMTTDLSVKSPLSPIQTILLIGLGAQNKSAEELGKELHLSGDQIMGQFQKVAHKLYTAFAPHSTYSKPPAHSRPPEGEPSPKRARASMFKNLITPGQ